MKEKIMKVLLFVSAALSICSAAAVILFLLYKGIPAIREIGAAEFISGKSWKPTEGHLSYDIGQCLCDRRRRDFGGGTLYIDGSVFNMVLLEKSL